jgi:hypothetical protein
LGYLNNYPDRPIHAENLQDLKERLNDLRQTLKAERVWEAERGRIRKPELAQKR